MAQQKASLIGVVGGILICSCLIIGVDGGAGVVEFILRSSHLSPRGRLIKKRKSA
jgi:hypothetical protein